MATDSAPTTRSAAAQSWQVPVFFVGLLALAAVTLGRPYLDRLSPHGPDRLLDNARTALAAQPPDLDAVADNARRLVDRTELPPRVRGEANYLLGSALLIRADSAVPADAAPQRQQARHYLEQADALGVNESDRPRLTIRLAKVWLATGVDAQQAVKALSRVADSADDPFETFGLLAEAYGRLTPSDPAGALEAVRQQVARATDKADPVKLARARLQLATLLLQHQNAREARLVLMRITGDAPPDVLSVSRRLAARCHEEAQDWSAAARAWELISKDPRLPPGEKAPALYALGRAQFNGGLPAEAAVTWQAAAALEGPEGQAAALRLAELRIAEDPKGALTALAEALRSVNRPDDYRNAVATLDEVRGLFERSGEQLRSRNDFDTAAELAKLYAKIAPPGRAPAQEAFAAASRADDLARKGQAADAALHFAAASRYFLTAAEAVPESADGAAWLAMAADAAIKAKDYPTALDALGRYVKLETVIGPPKAAEAYFTAGQVHENLNDVAAAKVAYQRCLSAPGPARSRARYQLALLDLTDARRDEKARQAAGTDEADRLLPELRAKVKFDDAERMLQDNLAELRQAEQPDAAIQELTVFGLADVAYERGDYATAEPRLKGALQEYPESRHVPRGRYRLALCVYRRAVEENKSLNDIKLAGAQRERLQRQYLGSLAQSQEQFAAAEQALLPKHAAGSLTPDESEMLARAGFGVVTVQQAAGQYDDALKTFERLEKRYDGRPEGLQAIFGQWQCLYHYLNRPEPALDRLQRLRDAVDKTPDAAFDGSSDLYRRDYWTAKIVEMGKVMGK